MRNKKITTANRGIMIQALKKMHSVLIEVIPESSRCYRFLYFLGLRVSARERLKKRHVLELCVPLARHCNLNCRGCSAFSPISAPHFYELKNLKKDLGHISKVVAHKVDCLYLNGGEPLLHPDLTKIIYFAENVFQQD